MAQGRSRAGVAILGAWEKKGQAGRTEKWTAKPSTCGGVIVMAVLKDKKDIQRGEPFNHLPNVKKARSP